MKYKTIKYAFNIILNYMLFFIIQNYFYFKKLINKNYLQYLSFLTL